MDIEGIDFDKDASKSVFLSDDKFYRALHPIWMFDDGKISTAAFNNERLSVDWARYSSVAQTRLRWTPKHGVVSITAMLCWELKQDVAHCPSKSNKSHCEVRGRKTGSIQKKFRDQAQKEYWP